MFLPIQLDIGAESLPGSQNCTNCYCLAPVRPAANARNRQKSKRQQINASKIIGADSLPGSQNCTNCYCLAPVRPAANARICQKSEQQQINAYKSNWIGQNIPRAHNPQLNDKCPWTPSPPRSFGHSTTLHPQALSSVAELPQCHSLAVNHARQPAEKISFPGNGINLIPHSKYVSKPYPPHRLCLGHTAAGNPPSDRPVPGLRLGTSLHGNPLGFKRPHLLNTPRLKRKPSGSVFANPARYWSRKPAGKPKLHQLLLPGPC